MIKEIQIEAVFIGGKNVITKNKLEQNVTSFHLDFAQICKYLAFLQVQMKECWQFLLGIRIS